MPLHDIGALLDLARDLGINSGEQPTDEAYDALERDFYAYSARRDADLRGYIAATPLRHRTYIPNTPQAPELALRVMWYFDEVILRDPLGVVFEQGKSQRDVAKTQILTALGSLRRVLPAIETGTIRLAGPGIVCYDNPSDSEIASDPLVRSLLSNELARGAIFRSLRYGMLEIQSPNAIGACYISEISHDVGGISRFHGQLRVRDGQVAIPIPIRADLPSVSRDVFLARFGADAEQGIERLFSRAIYTAVACGRNAILVDACLMSNRPYVGEILALAPTGAPSPTRQKALEGLNLSLPYLGNADPNRLMEIRVADPLAFREFRAELLQSIDAARKESPESAASRAHELLQRRAIPSLRTLQNEMNAWAQRVGLFAAGLPTLVGVGMLMGTHYQLPAVSAGATVTAGGAAIAAASTLLAERAKLKSNSFYFLWKARKR